MLAEFGGWILQQSRESVGILSGRGLIKQACQEWTATSPTSLPTLGMLPWKPSPISFQHIPAATSAGASFVPDRRSTGRQRYTERARQTCSSIQTADLSTASKGQTYAEQVIWCSWQYATSSLEAADLTACTGTIRKRPKLVPPCR